MIINEGLGLNIQRVFLQDTSDSLNDELRETIAKRQSRHGTYNFNFGYSKDSFNVYYMGQKIDGASVMSFQVLNYGYAKDSFNVYFNGQKIPNASAMTFQVIGNGYAKDAWSVYYMGRKMEGVSPNSFSVNPFG